MRPYSGLLSTRAGCKREDFPLLNARVHYDLSDVQMLAKLVQTYTSNATVEAEICYVFPLPPDASVCDFEAVIDGGRKIKGVVKEKAKAKAEYEQAVAQGKTAAVLEQHNVEIFQVSLGNIRPKQTIEVHISFVAVVSHDGALDSLRLTFPSTIAPRYGTPPTGLSGPYTTVNNSVLDFSVAVEMASHIKSITSPSHPIAMKLGESTIDSSAEFDPTKARISLASPTLLEKDIVVVLSCQGLDKPRCMVESFSPEEGAQEYTDAYALTLVPRFELPALPSQEYIFLVDRSGSMDGGKMDAVRSALQILLISLPSRGTYFNMISFGSRHSSLWPQSVTYSAKSVKQASAHVDKMKADFGGTEIRAAIEAAIKSRMAHSGGETTATTVFVLTDGQSYDLEGVQSSIQAFVTEAKAGGLLLRLFCMGIGNAVSRAMCEKIARAGQGTAAFVGETEKPDQKLMGLLRAARGGVVEDISIEWGVGAEDDADHDFEVVPPPKYDAPREPAPAPLSLFNESLITSEKKDVGPQPIAIPPPLRVQQAPVTESLPPLYPGFRTSIFAIVKRGKGSPSQSVHIKGSVLGRPVVLTVPVSRTAVAVPASIKMLHVLAARALIQSIEEGEDYLMSETKKAEVLRLAERYGLASSQTSFLAVDEQGKSVDIMEKSTADELEKAQHLGMGLRRAGFGGIAPSGAGPSYSVHGPARAKSAMPLPGASLIRSISKRIGSASTRVGGTIPSLASSGKSASVVSRSSSASPRPSGQNWTVSYEGRGAGIAPQAPTSNVVMMPHSTSSGRLSASAQTSSGASVTPSPEPVSDDRKRESVRLRDYGSTPRKQLSTTPTSTTAAGPISVEAFARLQSFDGSFPPSPALFKILGDVHTPPDIKKVVWCTLLCIAYLETKFAEEQKVWEVMVEKAMQFVEDAVGEGGVEANMLRGKARAYISA